jgi:hypothetical protein
MRRVRSRVALRPSRGGRASARRTPVVLGVLAALLAACAPAANGATATWPAVSTAPPTPAALTALTDRLVDAWAPYRQAGGLFRDPIAGGSMGGYGGMMLDDATVRAGVRRGDAGLTWLGLTSIDARLSASNSSSPFDLLAAVNAYRYADRNLAGNATWRFMRPRWRDRLARWALPTPQNNPSSHDCYTDVDCFNNWKLVEAAGIAQLLDTGIPGSGTGALTDRAGLCARIGRWTNDLAVASAGPRTRVLGALARFVGDRPKEPLAYHGFSIAALAIVFDSPSGSRCMGPAGRRLFREGRQFTLGAMAPDGSVSYQGRSNEQTWTLAATLAVGATALKGATAGAWSRALRVTWAALQRRAWVDGVLVTTPGTIAGTYAGTDSYADLVTYNGLVAFELGQAAAALPPTLPDPKSIVADHDGTGIDDALGSGVVTLRRGPWWLAVQARSTAKDRRSLAGTLQVEHRKGGAWSTITPGRPTGPAEPTPLPQLRVGPRWASLVMHPSSVRVSSDTIQEVGTFRDGHRAVLTTRVRWRIGPAGVTQSVRLRRGDRVRWTTYVSTPRTASRGWTTPLSRVAFTQPGRRDGSTRGAPTALDAAARQALWISRPARRAGWSSQTIDAR